MTMRKNIKYSFQLLSNYVEYYNAVCCMGVGKAVFIEMSVVLGAVNARGQCFVV